MCVTSRRRHAAVFALALLFSTVPVTAGVDPVKAFAKEWEGRRVLLKGTLYTLVYDEVGRLGATKRGKAEGLTVATPVSGTYYRFLGRQGRPEIVAHDPNQLVDQISTGYKRSKHFEIGTVSMVEPIKLVRYSPGVELVVQGVATDGKSVSFLFHARGATAGSQAATSLTIEWPTALSPEFTERPTIEALALQFIDVL
jgi:hypothetical protein